MWHKTVAILMLIGIVVGVFLLPHTPRAQQATPVPVQSSPPPLPCPASHGSSSEDGDDGRDWHLLSAIIAVESSNNPDAYNKRENAAGILQIRPIMVADCNRIIGHPEFTLADRYNPELSTEMFWTYTDHYSKNADRQTVARRWNGGPKGNTKSATVDYWRKVKANLNEQAGTKTAGSARAAHSRSTGTKHGTSRN